MKKTLIILLFVPFILKAQTNQEILKQVSKPYNIKEFFFLMPDSMLNDIPLKNRHFMTKAKSLKELWDANCWYMIDTIDYKNAYMKFSSTGDGEGTYFEITYYIKKDKSKMIAVNNTYWNMCCENSNLKFYTLKGKKWTEITKHVIPNIKLSEFIPESVYKGLIKNDLINDPPIVVKLPQKGKTIKVMFEGNGFENATEDLSKEDYDKLLKAINCNTLDLIWKAGRFVIGNKKK